MPTKITVLFDSPADLQARGGRGRDDRGGRRMVRRRAAAGDGRFTAIFFDVEE